MTGEHLDTIRMARAQIAAATTCLDRELSKIRKAIIEAVHDFETLSGCIQEEKWKNFAREAKERLEEAVK